MAGRRGPPAGQGIRLAETRHPAERNQERTHPGGCGGCCGLVRSNPRPQKKKEDHMRRSRKKWKMMYIQDDLSESIWVRFSRAVASITFMLTIDRLFVRMSRRGVPWKCLLARGAVFAARRDGSLFPHAVIYGYAEGNYLYLIDKRPGRGHRDYHAFKYRHNFTKTLREFDNMTKAQFIEKFGREGVEITFTVPKLSGRSGQHSGPRPPRPPRDPAAPPRLVGAWRRAKDAGLLPPGSRPAL